MVYLSWRSIELQVALPRTQDAGKLQEQMMKQSQNLQESLAAVQLKQQDHDRKRVTDLQETSHLSNSKKKDNSNDDLNQGNNKSKKDKDYSTEHPYLGNHIDFDG